MDGLQTKYRKQRLLNKLMLYSFTALTCILLLSTPLWYPLLRVFLKSLLFVSFPKVCALFLSSKCIFLVGNLIVLFLLGESKIFKSTSSSLPSNVLKLNYAAEQANDQNNFIFLVGGDYKISRSKYSYSLPFSVNLKYGEQEEEFFGYVDEEEKDQKSVGKFKEFKFGAEPNELSKRADDFIARVNKQIRLEAVSMI